MKNSLPRFSHLVQWTLKIDWMDLMSVKAVGPFLFGKPNSLDQVEITEPLSSPRNEARRVGIAIPYFTRAMAMACHGSDESSMDWGVVGFVWFCW